MPNSCVHKRTRLSSSMESELWIKRDFKKIHSINKEKKIKLTAVVFSREQWIVRLDSLTGPAQVLFVVPGIPPAELLGSACATLVSKSQQ